MPSDPELHRDADPAVRDSVRQAVQKKSATALKKIKVFLAQVKKFPLKFQMTALFCQQSSRARRKEQGRIEVLAHSGCGQPHSSPAATCIVV